LSSSFPFFSSSSFFSCRSMAWRGAPGIFADLGVFFFFFFLFPLSFPSRRRRVDVLPKRTVFHFFSPPLLSLLFSSPLFFPPPPSFSHAHAFRGPRQRTSDTTNSLLFFFFFFLPSLLLFFLRRNPVTAEREGRSSPLFSLSLRGAQICQEGSVEGSPPLPPFFFPLPLLLPPPFLAGRISFVLSPAGARSIYSFLPSPLLPLFSLPLPFFDPCKIKPLDDRW